MVQGILSILLFLFHGLFVSVFRPGVPQTDLTRRELLLDLWREVAFDAEKLPHAVKAPALLHHARNLARDEFNEAFDAHEARAREDFLHVTERSRHVVPDDFGLEEVGVPRRDQTIEMAIRGQWFGQPAGHALLGAGCDHLVLHENVDELEDAQVERHEDLLRLYQIHQHVMVLVLLPLIVGWKVSLCAEIQSQRLSNLL